MTLKYSALSLPHEPPMTDLVVRRLLVDMQAPIARHWCAGDAFRTALFNALSMSFPGGEQFFIDAVRAGVQALPADRQERFRRELQGFIGQEATHRRLHALYNQQLEHLGLVNDWEPNLLQRLDFFRGKDPLYGLAITAALEHFTAIMAKWLLTHREVLGDRDERLATLWLWHACEESEHKSTAFDLFAACGGTHEWRIKWFRRITLLFVTQLAQQTVRNLRRDGTLWRWRTWRSAAGFLFGRSGLVRCTFGLWRDYLRRDFHPSQQDASEAQRWLAEHADRYTPVATPG
jgi:hypothetical protein